MTNTYPTKEHTTMTTTDEQRHQELHDHYASNAIARGHAADCDLVTTPINWPTICGRPICSCEVQGR